MYYVPYVILLAYLTISTVIAVGSDPAVNDVIVVRERTHGILRSTPLHIFLDLLFDEDNKHNQISKVQLVVANRRATLHNFAKNNQGIMKTGGIGHNALKKLALKIGRNGAKLVLFGIKGGKDVVKQIPFNIYLWNWTDKLVVTDIDGTVTKEDMMDIVFPKMDWAHKGVKGLYNKIVDQGYRMVYLTARPVTLAELSKKYMWGNGMPLGPMLMVPSNMAEAMEIQMDPTEYKVGFMRNIKKLFPHRLHPFHAGIGNTETDQSAYEDVGIPLILIINAEGEVILYFGEERRKRKHSLVIGDPWTIDQATDYVTLRQDIQLFFPKLR